MRRQADLYFMFHMYEQAYQTYQLLKRDFNNDHAWLYYAGTLVFDNHFVTDCMFIVALSLQVLTHLGELF